MVSPTTPVPFSESVLVTSSLALRQRRDRGVVGFAVAVGVDVGRVVGVVGVVGDRVAAGVVAGGGCGVRDLPASTSVWVIVWVAVHVALAPGASVKASTGVQASDPSASARLSVTSMLSTVTVPVLVTVMV